MAKKLKDCFPMIREENELLAEIRESETLRRTFQGWPEEKQRIFLDCCTGARGVKMLYDSFFKEIMNPEKNPERIEELLSLLLDRQVRILKVLPLEGTRLAGAHSPVIMDIVVELEGGSLANVEVQKLGCRFPGQTGCVAGFPEHGGAGGDPGPSGVLPGFWEAYEEIYRLCRNVEDIMEMFSRELQELDRNTVQYMMDEMQEEIDQQKEEISQQKEKLDQKDRELEELRKRIQELESGRNGK